MSEGLAIGLVGCGRWGRLVLRDLVSLGCRVAVASRDPAHLDHARAAGATLTVDSIAALPRDLAGYVAVTPATTHAQVIEALLDRGRPIFVEKPMTIDAAAAARLAASAADRLFVMEKWRYHPGVEALKQVAQSGELGPVEGVRTVRVGWGHIYEDVDPVWTLAPHDLSIVQELLGHLPPPRAAFADWHGGVPVGLIGVLGDGPTAVIEVSARRPQERRMVELLCRDGVATLAESYGDSITLYRGPPAKGRVEAVGERRPVSSEMPLLRELEDFVGHCAGGPPPRCGAADGAQSVAAIAELRRLAGLDLGPGVLPA